MLSSDLALTRLFRPHAPTSHFSQCGFASNFKHGPGCPCAKGGCSWCEAGTSQRVAPKCNTVLPARTLLRNEPEGNEKCSPINFARLSSLTNSATHACVMDSNTYGCEGGVANIGQPCPEFCGILLSRVVACRNHESQRTSKSNSEGACVKGIALEPVPPHSQNLPPPFPGAAAEAGPRVKKSMKTASSVF